MTEQLSSNLCAGCSKEVDPSESLCPSCEGKLMRNDVVWSASAAEHVTVKKSNQREL